MSEFYMTGTFDRIYVDMQCVGAFGGKAYIYIDSKKKIFPCRGTNKL